MCLKHDDISNKEVYEPDCIDMDDLNAIPACITK